MQFLPIQRWQGGLLGCSIAQWLTQSNANSPTVTRQIGQNLMQNLIEKRQLSEQDWLNLYQKYSREWPVSRTDESILTLIPLFLLYHDSQRELEQQLALVQDITGQPTEAIGDLAVWGYLSSLVLKEQLQPQQWLDRVIQMAQTKQTPLKKLLQLVKRLLQDAIPLRQGIRQLTYEENPNQLAIAISIYCFGSTPDNSRLTMLRASQVQQSPVAVALTGFLCGIYNSVSGFPLSWRIAARNFPTSLSANRETSDRQALQLFAAWSGVYEPNAHHSLPMSPIASSGVIQRRTSLNIVSQDRL